MDYLLNLALEKVVSVFRGTRAVYCHFENLLAEVAAASQNGSNSTQFGAVFLLPVAGLGGFMIFPSAIKHVHLSNAMSENILMKGEVDALNWNRSDAEIVLEFVADAAKANVRSVGAGQLRGISAGRPTKEKGLPLVAGSIVPGFGLAFIKAQHGFEAGIDGNGLRVKLSIRPDDGPASVLHGVGFMTPIPELGGGFGKDNPCQHADKEGVGQKSEIR